MRLSSYLHDCVPNKNCYLIKRRILDNGEPFLNNDGLIDGTYKTINTSTALIPQIETHVVDYCNLNCKACNHFTPYYSSGKIDLDKYERSLQLLSKMLIIDRFYLLGGEALLEPDLTIDCLKTARARLPDTDIYIYTNGLLLPKMDKEFFESVKKYEGIIFVTQYPPTVKQLESIKQTLDSNDITYTMSGVVKKFGKSLSLKRDSKNVDYMDRCFSNGCTFLRDGKLFKCPITALCRRFNECNGTSIGVSEGFELDESTDGWVMLNNLLKPSETCYYCAPQKMQWIGWGPAGIKKNKDDWLIIEPKEKKSLFSLIKRGHKND